MKRIRSPSSSTIRASSAGEPDTRLDPRGLSVIEIDRRMRVRSRREQEVAALGREREQAAVDEVVERLGHGQRLPASTETPERASMRTISSA